MYNIFTFYKILHENKSDARHQPQPSACALAETVFGYKFVRVDLFRFFTYVVEISSKGKIKNNNSLPIQDFKVRGMNTNKIKTSHRKGDLMNRKHIEQKICVTQKNNYVYGAI